YRAAFATLSLGGLLGALLKERPKPTFAGTLVHHASVRGGDRTTAVNQQRHRHGIELVFLSETSIVDHDWVVYLFLFNECLHWFPTFVHRNADNREPAVLVSFLKFNKPGDFKNTAVAPSCPEIEQDHPAFVVGQSDGYTFGVIQSKVRGRFLGL